MLDGFEIIKELKGEEVNLSPLILIGSSIYGKQYKFKSSLLSKYYGSSPTITINDRIKIKGSISYFLKDNNLVPLTLKEIECAFENISIILGIKLNDAEVKNFEFGTALEIPFLCKDLIYHHIGISNMDVSDYQKKGKYFQNKSRRIKLYDAGLNAKFKLSKSLRNNLINEGKYENHKSYIKFEIKYNSPLKYFKKKVLVSDLQDTKFLRLCIEDLLSTYCKIRKTGFYTPQSHKELTGIKIFAIVLKEIEQLYGFDVEGHVEKFIKKSKVLDNSHKYERRKATQKAFLNLDNSKNTFDISDRLHIITGKFIES